VGTSCTVLLGACGLSLTAGAAAQAAPTHSTDDFGFETGPGDLCSFAVHLTVHNDIDTVRQTTAQGTREVDHIVETDTVAAHGTSVQGLPYHWTLTADIDASGHLLRLLAQGQTWRFPLPDGGDPLIDAILRLHTDRQLVGLAAILGPSLKNATIALGVSAVPGLIRIARGETLALREEDFIPAAIANGANDLTVIFRHILPNMTNTLIVQATLLIPAAIIGEAVLSFLGLGVQPPTPSWGTMLQDAQSYLSQAPRLAVYPGLAIVLAALAFNVLGDGLRDILDPRTTR